MEESNETTEVVEAGVDAPADETTEEVAAEEVVEEAPDHSELKVAQPNEKSKVQSLTNGDWFAGYGTADLRAHLRFWMNDARSKGAAEHLALTDDRFAEMTRKDHIRMIEDELAARDAARSKGGPTA